MATIEENVRALQAKLEEAKKQLFEKEEKERLEKERSWEYNVDVIQNNIKMAAAGKEVPTTRQIARFMIPRNIVEKRMCNFLQPFMTSVLECLQRLDERIKAIEETIPPPEV